MSKIRPNIYTYYMVIEEKLYDNVYVPDPGMIII